MSVRESLRTTTLGIGGAVVAAGLFIHAHHLRQQAAEGRSEAAQATRQSEQMAATLRRGIATEPPAKDVTEATAYAVSSLRAASAVSDVSIGQVSVIGATQNGASNLQNIAAAARSARAVGLRRIEVTVAGGWKTLGDLQHLMDAVASQPVRLKGLNIGKDYFRFTLDVYGR